MQRVGVTGEVGGEHVRTTVAIDITNGNAHGGLPCTVNVGGDAGGHAAFFKSQWTSGLRAIHEQRILLGIIGNEDIEPSVGIKINHGKIQPVSRNRFANSRRLADIAEGSITAVLIEQVSARWQSARTRHHLHALEGSRRRWRCRIEV